jgi:mRNA-degrading endonuclease YafQ of YafQ-DinJ toxin-antitoxin module
MPRVERRRGFRRRFRRLAPADQRAVERALRWLAANPRDRRLRTHRPDGSERWASSYAPDGRIVFRWLDQAGLIVLLDVGTHDDVY